MGVPDNLTGGEAPSAPGDESATQSCSICSGRPGIFVLNTPDNILSFPDNISVPNIEAREETCTLVEQVCQMGFCNAEVCKALAESGAKETCGCGEPQRL